VEALWRFCLCQGFPHSCRPCGGFPSGGGPGRTEEEEAFKGPFGGGAGGPISAGAMAFGILSEGTSPQRHRNGAESILV